VYREQLPHAELNSKEVGSFVANRIIESLLGDRSYGGAGTVTGVNIDIAGTYDTANGVRVRLPIPIQASKLPSFAQAKSISAYLPGGLVLFHSASPSAATTREFQPLITGEPGTEKLCVLKVSS
jgi:hypothetical protein